MSPNVIAAGVFRIAGTVLGVVLGLVGERWARTRGDVECKVTWQPIVGAGGPPKYQARARKLEATFLNRKDIPVVVWSMAVEFYKGGQRPPEPARPAVESSEPLDVVSLPSRTPITRTIRVTPDLEPERLRWAEEADRVEFVAFIDEARDVQMGLNRWNDPSVQTGWWRRGRELQR